MSDVPEEFDHSPSSPESLRSDDSRLGIDLQGRLQAEFSSGSASEHLSPVSPKSIQCPSPLSPRDIDTPERMMHAHTELFQKISRVTQTSSDPKEVAHAGPNRTIIDLDPSCSDGTPMNPNNGPKHHNSLSPGSLGALDSLVSENTSTIWEVLNSETSTCGNEHEGLN